MYKIEKNVKLNKKSKYPFSEMEIGDSFFIPNGTTNTAVSVNVLSKSYREINPSFKITTRKVAENGIEGVRVWRIK